MAPQSLLAPVDPADWTAQRLLLRAPAVSPRAACAEVAELFQTDAKLQALVVLDEEGCRPLALADRSTFLLHFAQRYGRDLYAKRPVLHLADRHPLVVPLETSLASLSDRIAEEKPEALHRGFILVEGNGHYAGIGLGVELMRLTAEQMAVTLERLQVTQRDLIQSEKMAALGGLVAGVAHEINTPLGVAVTAVSAFAQETRQFQAAYRAGTLKRSDLEDYVASATEATGFIIGNIGRAADLVQAFKQVAVDQTTDMPRHFDLGDYVGEVLRSLQPQLRRGRHRVDADLPTGLLVDSAPGAVAQIVTNLVMNALTHAFPEAGGEAGTIRLTIERVAVPDMASDLVRLTVADDGTGIPEAVLPQIFDPFFTTRRDAGGTGLGLHVVYNLVTQRLGGRIQVDSQVGSGTRFTILFPQRVTTK